MTDPVTLTLARADAEMLRALIDRRNLYVWDDQSRAYRITPELVAALDAALAAPVEPEPDTLEEAVAECWSRDWEAMFLATRQHQGQPTAVIYTRNRFGASARGDTPLLALRAAMRQAEGGRE